MFRRRFAGVALRFVALAVIGGFAAACSKTTGTIDTLTTTSAISMAEASPTIAADPFVKRPDTGGAEADRLLDEDTMRLSVTTADLAKMGSTGLPWANAATGSTGTVTTITEREVSGQTCRAFTATREAYDGVTLYNGDICLDRRSGWWTRVLAPVGSAAAS